MVYTMRVPTESLWCVKTVPVTLRHWRKDPPHIAVSAQPEMQTISMHVIDPLPAQVQTRHNRPGSGPGQ
jgi:hypothetical protein